MKLTLLLLPLVAATALAQPPPTIPGWGGYPQTIPPGTVMSFQKWQTMCPYCLVTNILRCYATNMTGGYTIPPGTSYSTNLGAAPLPGATCTTNLQVSVQGGVITTNLGVTCVFMSGGTRQDGSLSFWCNNCGAFFTTPAPPRYIPIVPAIPAVPMPKSAGTGREEMVLPGVIIEDTAPAPMPPPTPTPEPVRSYRWTTNKDGSIIAKPLHGSLLPIGTTERLAIMPQVLQPKEPGVGTLTLTIGNVTGMNIANWIPGVDEMGNSNMAAMVTNTYDGPTLNFGIDSLPDGTVMGIQWTTNFIDWHFFPSDGFYLNLTSTNLYGGAPLYSSNFFDAPIDLTVPVFFRGKLLVQPPQSLRLPSPRVPNKHMDASRGIKLLEVGDGLVATNLLDESVMDVWSGATVPADTSGDDATGTLAMVCYTGPGFILTGDGDVECSHDLTNWFAYPSVDLQVRLEPGSSYASPISSANQYFRTVPF